MDDVDDFTFCKVEGEVDDDHLGSPKRMPDIKSITLDSKGRTMLQADTPQKTDGVGDIRSNGSSSNDINTTTKNTDLRESRITKSIVEGSTTQSTMQKAAIKKPSLRAKVPFEKGYSQMDWLKLTRTHPDLAGLKGQSNRRLISMDEVKQHKSDGSVWAVLKGRVYNISPYMKFHPGGVDMLMKAAGKDCTSLFNKYHAWVNAEFLLEKCLVGMLDSN